MREIKFRGERLDRPQWETGLPDRQDGEWCINQYQVDPDTIGQYIGLQDATKFEELPELEQQKFLAQRKYDGSFNTPQDWKGIEVFEGDIVKTPIKRIGVIEYGHGRFGINFDYGTDDQSMYGGWGQIDNLRSLHDGYLDAKGFEPKYQGCKVIGNVYDSPELLNTAK